MAYGDNHTGERISGILKSGSDLPDQVDDEAYKMSCENWIETLRLVGQKIDADHLMEGEDIEGIYDQRIPLGDGQYAIWNPVNRPWPLVIQADFYPDRLHLVIRQWSEVEFDDEETEKLAAYFAKHHPATMKSFDRYRRVSAELKEEERDIDPESYRMETCPFHGLPATPGTARWLLSVLENRCSWAADGSDCFPTPKGPTRGVMVTSFGMRREPLDDGKKFGMLQQINWDATWVTERVKRQALIVAGKHVVWWGKINDSHFKSDSRSLNHTAKGEMDELDKDVASHITGEITLARVMENEIVRQEKLGNDLAQVELTDIKRQLLHEKIKTRISRAKKRRT